MPSTSFSEGDDVGAEPFSFEGAEKKMEIVFSSILDDYKSDISRGLRSYGREHWSEVISLLNGSILKHNAMEGYDAYLISESSLFVYPDRVVILTCGTTTLLRTLPAILESARKIDLDVCWFQYSRKNFLFPEKQLYPHTSFDQEVNFCSKIFADGQPYVLGPMNGDHWYVFVADRLSGEDQCDPRLDREQTLNIYMYGIDAEVASIFVKSEPMILPSILDLKDDGKKECGEVRILKTATSNLDSSFKFVTTAAEATSMSGIGSLMVVDDGEVVHDHLFEPCGYSMNGVASKDRYWTIHITPEAHCSYVSFETNLETSCFADLITRVVSVFRPQRFTTVVQADCNSKLARAQGGLSSMSAAALKGYTMSCRSGVEIGEKHAIQVVNYDALDQAGDESSGCTSSSGSQSSFESIE